MPRFAVAIALPRPEFEAVREQLAAAGYEALAVETADGLERLLGARNDVRVAILDGETDFDKTIEMYGLLHDAGRKVPALMLMPPRTLGRLGLTGHSDVKDEYFSRPYSAESLRWRVEAMLIRVEDVPAEAAATAGTLLEPPPGGTVPAWKTEGDPAIPGEPVRGRLIIVFNPKGGVGKTTISINLGADLQLRKHRRVLLVDGDTITGHIASSLGVDHPRTLSAAWGADRQYAMGETLAEVATVHSSGVGILVMAESPLHTEILEPRRVAEAVAVARYSYDFVILDMHPDYGPLNQALFELADSILVPVTPDVPCLRAAVQFREVATEMGLLDRLGMIINRADSGVSVADVERVVAIPTVARIRSAGMMFVRAADEGRSAVERFPSARVIHDIDGLADRVIAGFAPTASGKVGVAQHGRFAGSVRGLFGRRPARV